PRGVAGVDEAQAGIDAVGLTVGEIDPAVALVRKATQARLDAAVVACVEAQAQAEPALFIWSGAIDAAALAFNDWNEAVAAAVAAVDGDLPATDCRSSGR